jgi:hypothetical protein
MAGTDREPQSDTPDEASPTAQYANYFKVGYNPLEIVIDFGQFYIGDARPTIHTRVVTSPPFGRAFLDVLMQSVQDYEREIGPIAKPAGQGEGS